MFSRSLVTFAVLATASMSHAAVIGFDNGETRSGAAPTLSDDATTWSPGDWFGWGAHGSWPQAAGVPFAIADDSVNPISGGTFPPDTQGIIDGTKAATDQFFGVVDTVNNANPDGQASASWTFDVTGFSNLSVSADFAAMGDFESADQFLFTYAIDGGTAMSLFDIAVDEAASQNYTMESGTPVTLNDPVAIGGTLLDDVLTTFSSAIAGTGSILELTFTAEANGGAEAFVFDNLTITGDRAAVPVPTTLALIAFGLLGLRLMKR